MPAPDQLPIFTKQRQNLPRGKKASVTRRVNKDREQVLVRQCLDYLKLRGIVAWRQNSGGVKIPYGDREQFVRFASINGISDIIGVLRDGRFLAIECKVAGKKPSPDQVTFLEAIRKSGGVAVVAYELEDVIAVIDRGKAA